MINIILHILPFDGRHELEGLRPYIGNATTWVLFCHNSVFSHGVLNNHGLW